MTVIRPNSISGINSITANGGDINLFRADGTKADIPIVNNISAGVVTATTFSGNISGTTGTFTGNLGVGGVLTYEDVTNVDSVGVITARSGIRVGATGANTLISGTGTGIGIGTDSIDESLHIENLSGNAFHKIEASNIAGLKLKGGAGTNHIISDDTLTFFTNSSPSSGNGGSSSEERLRIKSDGKVNITPGGALSGNHPPGDLNIVGTNFLTMTPNDNANASDNEVLGVVAFLPYAAGSIAAASAKIEAVAESGQSGSSNATSLRFYNKNSSTGPGNSGTERMRITSNANGTGALYVNQTSEVSGANSHIVVNNSIACVSGSNFRSMYMSGSGVLHFWNGSNQPYITTGGSFTNASDVSLKKDITDLTYGIDVLKNLKPRKYKMKADDKEQIGFIAQEVESFIPEVVDIGETPDGTEQKGLSYGNLTAVLTKALQEAIAKIEKLEAEVNALKGS